MSSLAALEVAIGLSFIYFLLGVIVSRINEAVASGLQWRSRGLELGIRQLLSGTSNPDEATRLLGEGHTAATVTSGLQQLASLAYPLIRRFYTPRWFGRGERRPSYLPAREFSLAIVDILAPERLSTSQQAATTAELRAALAELRRSASPRAAATIRELRALLPDEDSTISGVDRQRFYRVVEGAQHLRDSDRLLLTSLLLELTTAADEPLAHIASTLDELGDNPVKEPLLSFVREAAGDLEAFRTRVEQWFDDGMARVSGWYKRRAQVALLGYSVFVVLALNIDTLTLARALWSEDVLRSSVIAATEAATDSNSDEAVDAVSQLEALDLPLGWESDDPRRQPPSGIEALLEKALGLGLTIGALSAGAPFWFDVLNRFASVRSAGPSTSGSSGGEEKT